MAQQAEQQQQQANVPARSEAAAELPTLTPPTDIYETADAYTMLLEMPGADPESLDVTLDKQMLTVSARATPGNPQNYTLVYSEYQLGNYERAFSLSDQIDEENIDAVFELGVLRLKLPKSKESRAKKISVKSEGDGR
jgi:HSP20 family molecular chaperone IbpA